MPHSDIRWIVRPRSILTTPKILKEILQARRTVAYPDPRQRKFSFQRDFFLTYPPIEYVGDFKDDAQKQSYTRLREFAAATKPAQRRCIRSGDASTPRTATTKSEAAGWVDSGANACTADAQGTTSSRYVVRPLRHAKGNHYRITDDPCDFEEGKEYISELFPKAFEYRVIYVKGKKTCTLIKRVPDDIDPDGPWNHAHGASFVTVTNPELDRLRNYDVYDKLAQHDIIKSAHLVGVDILLGKKKKNGYVITEFNFCPALLIENNLDLVKQHVHSTTG